MSQDNGHFFVSGTKIEVLGIQSRTSSVSALHGLVYAPPSTAAYLPCLPGSPCISAGVLTSFVPPVHNQGVSLAPLQGHALWIIFLPTTGSFFVISLTDLSHMLPSPAPFGGRFPGSFPILSSFPVTAGFNPQSKFLKVQPNYDRALPACGLCSFITLSGSAAS